ncbi:MAG: 2-C-methyl-D-erythritol 4-phosphate cytidylyltransferase [Lachnospiraceae bacterium]|nr:2-C-methyl-D-erythritol 4-phosphate cytidylyltransferase [Lachnospiraceae bacterium]
MGNDTKNEANDRGLRRAAVIVAAGKGLRAGTDVPKQYLPVGGRPMLCHSVETFLEAGANPVVIVVPAGDEDYVREKILPQMVLPHNAESGAPKTAERIIIVPGGAERHDSVYEGLKACSDSDFVWIHDAARPFVTRDILKEAMAGAEECGAAVPVTPVKDTVYVRGGTDGKLLADVPERDMLCAAQTPQTFRTELILRAHEWYRGLRGAEKAALKVTDDAMLARAVGAEVKLVYGSPANLKVTTPEDIQYLEKGGGL